MPIIKPLKQSIALSVLLAASTVGAQELEITPMFGQMFASDMKNTNDGSDLSVDSGSSFGIAVAWQDTPNGQGQVLIQSVGHNFKSSVDDNTYDLDILYAHFNGVAQFRQPNYTSTVSLGFGGAVFDSVNGEEFYPSATIAFGTKHEMANNFALVTEIRGYATLVDEADDLFCQGDICHSAFSDSIWIETSLSVGVSYKF